MGSIKFTTAGESHGRGLVAILEGIPAGLRLVVDDVNCELQRRMAGHGRGARMKIESDAVEFLSGVRAGETIGSPIAMIVWNKDWENWIDIMDPAPDPSDAKDRRRKVVRPRPGHADLAGTLKYDRSDARDVLERASARETAARVACGAVCKRLLREVGVDIGSHTVAIGDVSAPPYPELPESLNDVADKSAVRCLDESTSEAMVAAIDAAVKDRDTLGGVAEIVARGAVLGLGGHISWDRKLDGRLARALMSIQAVKGVEVGAGFGAARSRGSAVHDEIVRGGRGASGGFARRTNNAGGVEGGMTTGEPIVVRIAMKPISTLRRPLETVNLATGETAKAQSERADVTAVPAVGVIGETMVALVLADALVEKFGGDSLTDLKANREAYLARLQKRWDDLEGE